MTDLSLSSGLLEVPGVLELSAPATPPTIDVVHDLFAHVWHQHEDVDPATRLRIETAAVEVLTNIVDHAFALDVATPGGDGRRLTSAIAVRDDEVLVSFCDNGLPAELDLSAVTMPGEDAESGRGLAMAIAAVDEVRYDRVGGRNVWRLRCRIA